jgi:hypothetical protein
LAQGATLDKALEVWLANIDLGHAETIFFSAYALEKSGDSQQSRSLLAELSSEDWQELEEDLSRYLSDTSGWIRQWCEQTNAFRIQVAPGS